MLHPQLIRSNLFGGWGNLPYVAGNVFEANPDYPGSIILMTGLPSGVDDFSKRATYSGYADVQDGATRTNWTEFDTPPYYFANAVAFLFPAATADYNTPITHWAFSYPLVSDGVTQEILFAGELATPVLVSNGTAPLFAVGSLTYTLGDADD